MPKHLPISWHAAPAIPLIVLILTAGALAQSPPVKPSAADLFEQTLVAEGLEAALVKLNAALVDTTEPYTIDGFELGIALPARLAARRQRVEALELVKAVQPIFGEHPRYWLELGNAHFRCGNTDDARDALVRARDASDNLPDLVWMVEHVNELAANTELQIEWEDRLEPGGPTGLTGPYLGQVPPGRTPEVFAPGVLSTTAHEYHLSFAPDGRTIVFSRGGVGTLVTRWEDDGWTTPEVIHLMDDNYVTEEANFTPDGRAIVFCGRGGMRQDRELYRVERMQDGWSTPTHLFPGMYATSTLDGSLYYTVHGEERDYGVIVKRPWTGLGYGELEVVVGEGINTEFPDAHPWIAPDERLLLFDTYRDPGMGIYASFRQPDGSWSPAVSLHDKLAIPPVGQCALSHDGKYLFFCLAGDMYWVDAGFLVELKAGGPDG